MLVEFTAVPEFLDTEKRDKFPQGSEHQQRSQPLDNDNVHDATRRDASKGVRHFVLVCFCARQTFQNALNMLQRM